MTPHAHQNNPANTPLPTPIRVVSLLPSATELLAAVTDLAPHTNSILVGRSHECDYPPGLGSVPVLTRSRIDAAHVPSHAPGQSSLPDPRAINDEVSAALAQGRSLYEVDEALLRQLAPDLILTQDLCEVCSVDLRTVQRIAAALSPVPDVLSLNPATVEDVLDDLIRVGAGIDARVPGARDAAVRAAVLLRERMHAAQEHVNAFDEGPICLFLEWTDPPFCAGHWTVQLLERAGARHPFNPTVIPKGLGAATGLQQGARAAPKSRRLDPDEIVAQQPDVIIIAPCGLDLAATRACAASLREHSWFRHLPAVRSNRVALVDGNQMFNRPGPRLADAFAFLVGFLHDRPHLIPPNFPWEPWRA
jgi:ABC-type Fe3+-hydroxamate transport system substrate-binding protein